MTASSSLHHVVFAVALERHDAVAQMFTELGFTLAPTELTELGLRISLDWGHGIEVISPIPGSTAPVSASVSAFLDSKGDGVYTVVVWVRRDENEAPIAASNISNRVERPPLSGMTYAHGR